MAVPTWKGKEGTAVTVWHRESLRETDGLHRGEVTFLTISYTFRDCFYFLSTPY